MLNLQQLTTFVTVVSEGSMTAAADKLYLTQPAVSQQIRLLEEGLGVELLQRGSRQVRLTPHGEILIEFSRRIIQLTQNAEVAIKSLGSKLKGHLHIGTVSSVGLHLMSPMVSRLMRNNPELKIRLDYDLGDKLISEFKRGRIDVLILPHVGREFDVDLEQTEAKSFLKEEMWLVSGGKELGVPEEIDIELYDEWPVINLVDEYPGFTRALKEAMGARYDTLDVLFESSNVGTLKRVIESGMGWGFLPAHSIRKQVRSGRLTRTRVRDFNYDIDLVYYYKKDSDKKSLIEVFYQTLSQSERG